MVLDKDYEMVNEQHPIVGHFYDMKRLVTNMVRFTREVLQHDAQEWQYKLQLEIIARSISEIRTLCDVIEARLKGL